MQTIHRKRFEFDLDLTGLRLGSLESLEVPDAPIPSQKVYIGPVTNITPDEAEQLLGVFDFCLLL